MAKTYRIGMVAGEKSGDNLGAGFMKEMLDRHPQTRFEGIGGVAMQELGFHSLFPMERLSVMGFVEPLGRLPELLAIDRRLKKYFLDQPPDVFIGIDSPGFNTRLEEYLRAHGIPTVHYVSPSVWAYAEKRIERIKRAVDLMLVLFPFETAIYQAHEIPVRCVGHPLADALEADFDVHHARLECGLDTTGTVIALLPGSRLSEVKRLAPIFLEVAAQCRDRHPTVSFVLPCANTEIRTLIETAFGDPLIKSGTHLVDGHSQAAIRAADLVLSASGTATLETMLLRKPMVICYRVARLTYLLASRMLKVPYVGLPNLLAGEQLVPEYLQYQLTSENLLAEIEAFLDKPHSWDQRLERYDEIHRQLARNASREAVNAVLNLLRDD